MTAPPDRSPPHSTVAEEHVIACCLLDGGELDGAGNLTYYTLNRSITAGLKSDSFYFPANRLLFEVMVDLKTGNRPATLDVLAEELKTRRQLEAIGGFPYLMQVTGKIPTTAHAGYFIEKVRECEQKRALIRQATGLLEHAYNGSSIDELAQIAETLKPTPPRTRFNPESRLVTLAAKPTEPTTRLFLAKKPIATPGNLVTLISRAKTGKTAIIGGAVAAIIGAHYDRTGLDTLGFTAPHTKEAVILIDTEQSPYDAYTCHLRAFARAAQDDDVPWLKHYALVGCSAEQLRATLPEILAKAKQDHKAIFTLILDGVADFVASVNDEAECNGLVTWLRSIAVEYDCPIICVIHSNEAQKAGDDGRGHLGKQLTRKAESNLLLKKTGDVTVITSEKQRKAPITEKDGIAFCWSDEHGRHVSCTPDTTGKGGRPKTLTFQTFESIWPRTAEKAMTKNQILLYAKDVADVSESTLRKIIFAALNTGELIKIDSPIGPKYHLPGAPTA